MSNPRKVLAESKSQQPSEDAIIRFIADNIKDEKNSLIIFQYYQPLLQKLFCYSLLL